MICTPELDIQAFSGAKKCVEPGSVENGALCPLGEDDADAACASGQCGEVSVMGFLTLGVCGECKTDADCMGGTCTPARSARAVRWAASASDPRRLSPRRPAGASRPRASLVVDPSDDPMDML
ncbi:hypothetical protein [Nannocystis pusilla]|uniref:hypothetical protein n=1 Tax=Nannocystis pusilla TaxID=889268 RepID=UPI003B814891